MASSDTSAVAIIADAHFHDIHSNYDGAGLYVDGQRLTLRSWADTRASSRVFNESGAALATALEQVQRRGIRHVVLLGDYTDDGQAESTERLAGVLAQFRGRFGTNFYALPGNHDVFGPLGKHQSTRFVTEPGKSVLVTSDPDDAATEPESAILTPRMYREGMPAALMPIAEHGYFKASEYLHWETPFGTSDAVEDRMYTARSADGTVAHRLMDASYLVEPEPGLWLLMIDANVFEPRSGSYRPDQKKAFIDSTDAGWNAVLRVKSFLLDWIGDVCRRADKEGKTLLAFSHYPVIDPFDDATDSESALFGETEIVRRRPTPAVADALINAGLRYHFSGHYHVNAVSRRQGPAGQLTNISVPSPVAFPSGFMIAWPKDQGCDIEKVPLDSAPIDPRVMAVYRDEEASLGEHHDPALDCNDYGSFLYRQMHSRVLHHYLPRKWPQEIAEAVENASAANLGCWFLAESGGSKAPPSGMTQLASLAAQRGIDIAHLQNLSMTELIGDWYCLRQAGPMAAGHIPADRMVLYRFLAQEFGDPQPAKENYLIRFFAIFLRVLDRSISRMKPPIH